MRGCNDPRALVLELFADLVFGSTALVLLQAPLLEPVADVAQLFDCALRQRGARAEGTPANLGSATTDADARRRSQYGPSLRD